MRKTERRPYLLTEGLEGRASGGGLRRAEQGSLFGRRRIIAVVDRKPGYKIVSIVARQSVNWSSVRGGHEGWAKSYHPPLLAHPRTIYPVRNGHFREQPLPLNFTPMIPCGPQERARGILVCIAPVSLHVYVCVCIGDSSTMPPTLANFADACYKCLAAFYELKKNGFLGAPPNTWGGPEAVTWFYLHALGTQSDTFLDWNK